MRKLFSTDGIRGRVGGDKINPITITKLGWSLGRVLIENFGKSQVLVGKDTRISGYMLESALESGLSSAGVDIKLLGPMPTPAVSYLTKTLRAQAGIVISASHNLYHDNGIKFFLQDGRKLSDDLEAVIEKKMEEPLVTVASNKLGKAVRVVDAAGRYIEFCKSTVPTKFSLRGLKIVLDCAHGATYHVAPDIFSELGANVLVIGNQPNGFNINDGCGATETSLLAKTVVSEKADIGIALDGDGDRLIIIDEQGDILDGDDILYITTMLYKKLGILQGGVIGTVMSNVGLEKILVSEGIGFTRTPVGDRHIIQALQKHNWSLGGESSGHIVNFNFNDTGDGIIAALQVIRAMHVHQKSISELKLGDSKFPSLLTNLSISNADEILEKTAVKQAIDNIVQAASADSRILVRSSGTEPLIRIFVQSSTRTETSSISKQITELF